ncbi:MAG: PilZ domain-containing protein [Deltaproteobacteria bacterium]|nr:PilZ domain-containing protein [Deltaproteobacteria bacterium]
MLQEAEQAGTWAQLGDRRTNPFIRTRQRRNFDRRGAYRIGLNTLTFIHEGDEVFYGALKDISDTGARIEMDRAPGNGASLFTMGVPFLSNKKLACKRVWSDKSDDGGCGQYGVSFLDLSMQERSEMRKRFLLNEPLLLSHAEAAARRASDHAAVTEIKTFFMIDVRLALESLIDIDIMISQGQPGELIQAECTTALDSLVEAGDRLESCLDNPSLNSDIKNRVRLLLGHFIYQSAVFKRGFEKPHGYPGDFKMLEGVYNNRELSSGIGQYIDRYGLDVPYAVAIRRRKDKMRDILYDFIEAGREQPLHIINLASGACRDIREMFRRPLNHPSSVTITCIDQDPIALEYSRQTLSEISTGNIHVELVQGNILRLEALDLGPDGSVDMIYSIGIADYLQDRMLKKIFSDSYAKLKAGGKLVVAYKDKDSHRPIALNWYGDWYFIPRNEDELIRLINASMGSENISISIEREESGVIFFAIITKIK